MLPFKQFNTNLKHKEAYLKQGLITAHVHPTLAGSWQRSTRYNIDPHIAAAPVAPPANRSNLDQVLMDIALPYFKYFRHLLYINDSVLVLSNNKGVLLHVLMGPANKQLKQLAQKHNFLVDADWSEQSVGTNAIGTAIMEKSNIFISGYEHYSYTWHPYSCAAAPVIDEKTNTVVGVVNVTSFHGDLHIHSLGWVTALAKLIKKEITQHCIKQNNPNSPITVHTVSWNNTSFDIIGDSPAFISVLTDAKKSAQSHLNVLITGETGTGKEVLAKYIHYHSHRHQGPFVAVNCGAIPKELMASELFGYIDGAFTGAARRGRLGHFERAHGGTLFLDEIGDAPYEVQVGLLRVLEEKTLYRLGSERSIDIDVRIVAATSQDLFDLTAKGLFRKDLYYRLAGMVLEIPALRQRGQDIIRFAEYYLNQYNNNTSQQLVLDQDIKESMLEYHWPGNVRELKNIVERMASLADTTVLDRKLFSKCLPPTTSSFGDAASEERKELVRAMQQVKGNVTLAAQLLGVNRTTVYRRMKKHGLNRKIMGL